MYEIKKGAVTRVNAAAPPPAQRATLGNVVDGTKSAQITTAQHSNAPVSIAIDETVMVLEIPSFAASCNLDATASRPVGR